MKLSQPTSKSNPRNILGTPNFNPAASVTSQNLNTNLYPSVPTPQKNLEGIYQAVLLMNQVLSLLTVNTQKISNQTLTQSAQRFVKQTDHSNDITNLQNQISALQQYLGISQ
jgi:hypothetical protein